MRPNASSPFTRIMAALVSFLMAAVFVGVYSKFASAADLNVKIDQAKLVRLDKSGAEVIIGNPSIADVSVQSGRLLILTGKSIGLTNMIVLDGSGNVVLETKIHVGSDGKKLISVNKGAAHETYSCSPSCGPALVPGDAQPFFEPLSKAINVKLGLAQSAAEGTSPQ